MKSKFSIFVLLVLGLAGPVQAAAGWQLDLPLKFQLGYYSPEIRESGRLLERVPAVGLTADFLPDITNISLADFRQLGFPVAAPNQLTPHRFFLKFYQFPRKLDPCLSMEILSDKFLLGRLAQGNALEQMCLQKGAVVVKKGWSAPVGFPFSKQQPFPPLLVTDSENESAQIRFDHRLMFASMYVQPTVKVKPGDAVASRTGLAHLHQEFKQMYQRHLTVIQGSESEKYAYFLQPEGCRPNHQCTARFHVLRVPHQLMAFNNWRELPMPQDPKHMFLSGLLLIYRDTYESPELNHAQMSPGIVGSPEFNQRFQLKKTTVLEAGSVVRNR